MKNNIKRSLILCLIMVFVLQMAVVVSPAGFSAYAAETRATQLTNSDAYTVFVGTDRHGSTAGLKSTVRGAREFVISKYNTEISKTVHGGDLVNNTNTGSIAAVNEEFIDGLGGTITAGDCYYTYGHNHDSNITTDGPHAFLSSAGCSGQTSPTRDTGVVDFDGKIYLYGVDYYEVSNQTNATNASKAFKTWVEGLPEDDHRPIVIMSHMPLHDRRNSSSGGDNKGGLVWMNAINDAATDEQGKIVKDIFFFWGHNHTGWGGNDLTFEFVQPGGNIIPQDGNRTSAGNKPIYFTYGLAGFIGQTQGDWNGSTLTITSDTVLIDHFKYGSTSSTANHVETVPIERKDIEPLAAAQPEFKTQSLVLSGQIGVNFNMDLPEITGVNYAESYMTFDITGKGTVEERQDFDPTRTNRAGTLYTFTCYVNSIQMADTITAAFHYTENGEEKTIEKEYSVKEYIEGFDAALEANSSAFDDKTIALVHALANYGHYVQPFLSNARSWELGTDYAVMDKYYAENYNYTDIKEAISTKAIDRQIEGTDIDAITYSLTLDSETAINVYFKMAAGYDGSFSAKLNGETYTASKQSDGRYLIKIKGISAHLLDDVHNISVTTDGGGATVQVAALSYVYGLLNMTDASDEYKLAAAAIYSYSQAAEAYVA